MYSDLPEAPDGAPHGAPGEPEDDGGLQPGVLGNLPAPPPEEPAKQPCPPNSTTPRKSILRTPFTTPPSKHAALVSSPMISPCKLNTQKLPSPNASPKRKSTELTTNDASPTHTYSTPEKLPQKLPQKSPKKSPKKSLKKPLKCRRRVLKALASCCLQSA